MKKLLYTFLIGLLVISCNKNEESSIEAPVLEQEVMLIENDARNSMLEILFGGIADNAPVIKNSVSSLKGDDYIAAYIFTSDSESFIVLVDEDNDDLCFPDGLTVSTAYVNNAGSGRAHIENSEETVTKDLGDGYANLFSASLNEITKLDFEGDELIAGTAQFDDSNSATFTE